MTRRGKIGLGIAIAVGLGTAGGMYANGFQLRIAIAMALTVGVILQIVLSMLLEKRVP